MKRSEKKIEEMAIQELETRIRQIDIEVSRLERAQDKYMVSKGEMDLDNYNTVQKLMDERELLFIRKCELSK